MSAMVILVAMATVMPVATAIIAVLTIAVAMQLAVPDGAGRRIKVHLRILSVAVVALHLD